MELYSFLSSVTTVVSFVMFIAIVAWAWSRHRHDAYRDAANAPFALPDEIRTLDERRP
ncbi:MAG TPA: CcoQ/FixQ family Cbb3-type cytochrome c oxidase assembly chaperone [Casimicrobiaceae bacterium]|nr:CcoQ/FixQ family Cbb3-type cytochrome c oxidase assembly chaperone [Casimicrobiaceae bacterium]